MGLGRLRRELEAPAAHSGGAPPVGGSYDGFERSHEPTSGAWSCLVANDGRQLGRGFRNPGAADRAAANRVEGALWPWFGTGGPEPKGPEGPLQPRCRRGGFQASACVYSECTAGPQTRGGCRRNEARVGRRPRNKGHRSDRV